MKKSIVCVLVMVWIFGGLLVACTSSDTSSDIDSQDSSADSEEVEGTDNLNPTGFPIVEEPIQLKMIGSQATLVGPWEDLFFFTELEDMTNIEFEFDAIPSESYEERKNLAFASTELPDVFFGGNLTVSDEINYGSQGMLMPLGELIEEYAPNLNELMEQDPNIRGSITTTEGEIYALPSINNVPRDLTPKVWINEKWMDALDLEMPSTIDELFDVLLAFKEADPDVIGTEDVIPLTFDNEVTLDMLRLGLLSAFGHVDAEMEVNDGSVRYVPIQEGYKEYLIFMNKLYENDLLDSESFSQTTQELSAKGDQGRIGMFAHGSAYVITPIEESYNYSALPPLTSDLNSTQIWPKNPGITRGTFAISSDNPEPEASMRWVDYLYSEEGGAFASQGPEGMGWQWTDDTKSKWEKILPEGYDNTEEYRGGKISPQVGTAIPGIIDADFILKLDADHVSNLDKEVEENYIPHFKDVFPLVYFTEEEQNRITTIETDLNSYIERMEAQFITGEESLDNWDQYVNTIQDMGIDEALNIYQDAYDRWESAQ